MKWLISILILAVLAFQAQALPSRYEDKTLVWLSLVADREPPQEHHWKEDEKENGVTPAARVFFEKAFERMQLLNRIRDRIIPIMKAYQADQKDNSPEFSNILFHATEFDKDQWDVRRNDDWIDETKYKNVYFELTQGEKFRVQGVQEERLGINDGRNIYFNVAGLARLEKFEFSEALLLYLHEVFHYANSVPLNKRDQIASDIVIWVQARTQMIELGQGRKFMAILLNPNLPFPYQHYDAINKKLYNTTLSTEASLIVFLFEKNRIQDLTGFMFFRPDTLSNPEIVIQPKGLDYSRIEDCNLVIGAQTLIHQVNKVSDDQVAITYSLKNNYYRRKVCKKPIPSYVDSVTAAFMVNEFELVEDESLSPQPSIYDKTYVLNYYINSKSSDRTLIENQQSLSSYFEIKSIEPVNEGKRVVLSIRNVPTKKIKKTVPPWILYAQPTQNPSVELQYFSDKIKVVDNSTFEVTFMVPDFGMNLLKFGLYQHPANGISSELSVSTRKKISVPGGDYESKVSRRVFSYFQLMNTDKWYENPSSQEPVYLNCELKEARSVQMIIVQMYHLLHSFDSEQTLEDNRTHVAVNSPDSYTILNKYFFPIPNNESDYARVQLFLNGSYVREGTSVGGARDIWQDYGSRNIKKIQIIYKDGTVHNVDAADFWAYSTKFRIKARFHISSEDNFIYPVGLSRKKYYCVWPFGCSER